MSSYVIAAPEGLAAVSADLSGIGSAIRAAHTAAAASTTEVLAAGQDEVSAVTASLFGAYSQEFQAILRQATAFHDQFAAALAAAGNVYSQAEAQAAGTLAALTGGSATSPVYTTVTKAADPAVNAILIMTGSGQATPDTTYMNNVASRYLTNFTGPLQAVTTAEGFYPATGVKDLTVDISLARGVISLDNAINLAIHPGAGSIAVKGQSQSALISSLEMPKLLAEGFQPSQINFVLTGNEGNPNGGLLVRFPGLSFPSLGVTFGTATPSNDFPTTIWTLEYDGYADFPRYPINFLADLNAFAGIAFVHGTYSTLSATQLASAVTLSQSGAPSLTTYNMIPTQDLPLLTPLRALPLIGNPLADLLQPDLRYLVNWGYGDPNFGWSTSPADVPTPFGFLPPLSATTALGPLLVSGTQQGIGAFVGDLSALAPTSLPTLSSLLPGAASMGGVAPALPAPASIPSTLTGIISGIESANNNIVGTLTADITTAYSALLPTADLATAVVVTIPSYDLDLFLNGITQAINGDPVNGLVNAFGDPIAATVGLTTLAGGFEFTVIENTLQTIFTGTPNPGPE